MGARTRQLPLTIALTRTRPRRATACQSFPELGVGNVSRQRDHVPDTPLDVVRQAYVETMCKITCKICKKNNVLLQAGESTVAGRMKNMSVGSSVKVEQRLIEQSPDTSGGVYVNKDDLDFDPSD